MKTGNFKFTFYLLAATFGTIVIALVIEKYKPHFAFDDFGTITSIIQGTFGVAVSLAGAFVAIRLAQLSTLIIEKEKKREDSKFFHQLINEAISPIKKLTDQLQGFASSVYPYRAIFKIDQHDLEFIKPDALEGDLKKLKVDIAHAFEQLIDGLKGLTENQYSYAFWLYITDQRFKDNTLLAEGGGARDSIRFNNVDNQKNGYLLEDLNVLCEISQIALDRFLKCELTIEDLQTAKKIWFSGNRVYNNHVEVFFGQEFLITLTLLSCYSNRFHSVTPLSTDDYFENKFVLLFIDIYYNIPQKKDVLGFSGSLFPDDDSQIIENSPAVRAFDLLNDAYWLNFFTTSSIQKFDLKDLKSRKNGEILSNPECAKMWYNWQLRKKNLYNPYYVYDERFKKIRPDEVE